MNHLRTDFQSYRAASGQKTAAENEQNARRRKQGRRQGESNSEPYRDSGGFLADQVCCFPSKKDDITFEQNAAGVYDLISGSHKLETGKCDAKSRGFRNRLRGTAV